MVFLRKKSVHIAFIGFFLLILCIYFFAGKVHPNKNISLERQYSELRVLNKLMPGEYDNVSIFLTGDTIVLDGESLILKNSKIDLNNHSLIFRNGSKARILNSIILNASEEYWDGYVSRNPEEAGRIMQNGDKWGVEPSAGLAVETNDFVINNTIIKDSYGHGIYLYYAINPVIINCTFLHNAWSAIRSEGSWGIFFANNYLESNAWQNPERVGFAQTDISGGGNLTFSFNRINTTSVLEGAVTMYNQKNAIIMNNVIDDIFLIDNCNGCVIKNNVASGIYIYGGEGITMKNNTGNIHKSEKSGPEAWK